VAAHLGNAQARPAFLSIPPPQAAREKNDLKSYKLTFYGSSKLRERWSFTGTKEEPANPE
jgi:hypothetical protein